MIETNKAERNMLGLLTFLKFQLMIVTHYLLTLVPKIGVDFLQ